MDIQKIIAIVKETEPLFTSFTLRSGVHKKGDSDFVTEADLAISDYLCKRLREEFPHIGFLTEESDTYFLDPAKDYWILDPIDGTTNFMHGVPFCAVSLGLYSGGGKWLQA